MQCSKSHPAIGHFPAISLLCLDKIAFNWTNCLISYKKNEYINLTVKGNYKSRVVIAEWITTISHRT